MLTNQKLKDELIKHSRESRAYAKKSIQEAWAVLMTLEPIVEKLDAAGIEWHTGYLSISVMTQGKTKADFSATVERVAKALGEAPEIEVETGHYRANFSDKRVNVWLFSAEDCKLIEVEERKIVKRPHPACVAALSKLEDIA